MKQTWIGSDPFWVTMNNCMNCELYLTRNCIARARGVEVADVMFIGEAPGLKEDEVGLAFVGASGKLLNKWIRYLGLEHVYITNIVKCRPPKNRKPLQSEIRKCRQHLKDELRRVRPKVIVALGVTANNALKEMRSAIDGPFLFHNVHFIFNYHPAYYMYSKKDWKRDIDQMAKLLSDVGVL